jgi:L-cystine transport system substrate-binding protein
MITYSDFEGVIMSSMGRKFSILLLVCFALVAVTYAKPAKDKKGGGVPVVLVGTEGAYPPYNFVTKKGESDGYDVAVVKAIDALIPEITVKFVPTAWDGIFVALEGGEFNLIASNLGWRQEREDKYYLSTVPYLWGVSDIVYKTGRKDINSLTDLAGKKVAAGVGTSTTTQLEEYIKATGAKITIVYTDGNIVNALTEIDTGRVDATLSSIITTQLTAETLGVKVSGVAIKEWPVHSIHLLFPKTPEGKALRDQFDIALTTLLKNGTLSKLSRQYFFGKDYTTKEAATGSQ